MPKLSIHRIDLGRYGVYIGTQLVFLCSHPGIAASKVKALREALRG